MQHLGAYKHGLLATFTFQDRMLLDYLASSDQTTLLAGGFPGGPRPAFQRPQQPGAPPLRNPSGGLPPGPQPQRSMSGSLAPQPQPQRPVLGGRSNSGPQQSRPASASGPPTSTGGPPAGGPRQPGGPGLRPMPFGGPRPQPSSAPPGPQSGEDLLSNLVWSIIKIEP